MSPALAIAALLAVTLPHALGLSRVRPGAAVVLWSAALTLRALLATWLALFLLLAFPQTEAFRTVAHWCQHTVLPLAGLHFDLHGHLVAAVITALPAAFVGLSLAATVVRTGRARRTLSALLRSHALGSGPQRSVIVGGSEVLVAAAGIAHPRVIVSAGALTRLDDDELAAGLAHEHGHIARHHIPLLAYGDLCRSAAKLLPGTRRAVAELRVHIERDADAWAIGRCHDPRALARAISKSAESQRQIVAAARLHGDGVDRRLKELLEPPAARRSLRRGALDSTALIIAGIALVSAVALPAESLAGDRPHAAAHDEHRCQD